MSKFTTVTCSYCHKDFQKLIREATRSKNHFCNRSCQSQRRHSLKCLFCQKEFLAYASDLKRGNGKYCSQSCKTKYQFKIGKLKGTDFTPLNKIVLSPVERFFKGISLENHLRGCWMWTGNKNIQGYGKLTKEYKTITTHRFSWQIHFGEIPEGIFVCHKCDNPPCCNPEHLFLGDRSDNAKDMVSKGRNRDDKGSKHPMAKLTESIVLEIRERLKNGEKGSILSNEYNVGTMTISNIKNRKSWTHI